MNPSGSEVDFGFRYNISEPLYFKHSIINYGAFTLPNTKCETDTGTEKMVTELNGNLC